jgi:hypothetical protein
MIVRLNETEVQCIGLLYKWFMDNQIYQDREAVIAHLGISADTYVPLIRQMENLGVISPAHRDGEVAPTFMINPAITQVAREIESNRQEREDAVKHQDLVKQIKARMRQNPLVAWPILIILGVSFLATAINQVLDLIKKISGWLQ